MTDICKHSLLPLMPDDDERASIQGNLTDESLDKQLQLAEVPKRIKDLLTEEERNEYAEIHKNLVYGFVKTLHNMKIDNDELISISRLGFAKAILAFDKSLGNEFSTFAYKCMRNEVFYAYRSEVKHLYNDTSMNRKVDGDNASSATEFGDLLNNPDDLEGNKAMKISENRDLLLSILPKIPARDQFIIVERYGLRDNIPKTQEQVAKALGTTQANVSKLQKIALSRLYEIMTEVMEKPNLSLKDII